MSDTAHSLQLSLVSHTNVGKTTLARTLLGRDVGEVRDAAERPTRARGSASRTPARWAR
jgi:predicted GTPase